jgi:hypothetical protein
MLDDRFLVTTLSHETPCVVAESRSWSDGKTYGDVSIKLDWNAYLELAGPRTLTQEEAAQITRRFSEEHLRSKCMRLVLTMPEEILPFVCPELEELVSYEWRMLIERQSTRRPAIRESWGLLPAPA